jgi:protein arginine N-methyltransferase 3
MNSTDIPKVDIIVSEWMGYALLYEAMLDSVLYARDNFLKPEGLLLPCQATISIAPVYDPKYKADKVTFWKDVYGFDMGALVGNRIYEEAQVRTMPQGSIVGTSHVFAKLDLYTCTKADLSFKKPFSVMIESDVPSFDGFAIWFDVAFSAEKERLSTDSSGSDPSSDTTYHFRSAGHATLHRLSTSPYSGATHWEQSYLLIDPASRISDEHGGFTRNDQIEGEVTFSPRSDNDRALDIGVMWHSPRGDKGDQKWAMV